MSPQSASLKEQLAVIRAEGGVASSATKLFPARPLPSWSELRINAYLIGLSVALMLYFVSLYFVWQCFLAEHPFTAGQTKLIFTAVGINYFAMVGAACRIKHRLHVTGVQKIGWRPTLF